MIPLEQSRRVLFCTVLTCLLPTDETVADSRFAPEFVSALSSAMDLKSADLLLPLLDLSNETKIIQAKLLAYELANASDDPFTASTLTQLVSFLFSSVFIDDRRGYDSRVRILLRRTCAVFQASFTKESDAQRATFAELILPLESAFAHVCVDARAASSSGEDAQEETVSKSKARRRRYMRYGAVGFSAVVGGVLIGATGGLAAAPIAAGLAGASGALGLGAATAGVTTLLASSGGAVIAGVLFGASGASLSGVKMHRRLGDVKEFIFQRLFVNDDEHVEDSSTDAPAAGVHEENEDRKLCLRVGVSGYLTTKTSAQSVFKRAFSSGSFSPQVLSESESYALLWERKEQIDVGAAIEYYARDQALSLATSEVLKHTVFGALMAAVVWPKSLMSVANVIDNPWAVLGSRTYVKPMCGIH